MELSTIAKAVTGFHKKAFNNNFLSMTLVQDQIQGINLFWHRTLGLPEEGQKLVDRSIKILNEERDQFKTIVDQGFNDMEAVFAESEKGNARNC